MGSSSLEQRMQEILQMMETQAETVALMEIQLLEKSEMVNRYSDENQELLLKNMDLKAEKKKIKENLLTLTKRMQDYEPGRQHITVDLGKDEEDEDEEEKEEGRRTHGTSLGGGASALPPRSAISKGMITEDPVILKAQLRERTNRVEILSQENQEFKEKLEELEQALLDKECEVDALEVDKANLMKQMKKANFRPDVSSLSNTSFSGRASGSAIKLVQREGSKTHRCSKCHCHLKQGNESKTAMMSKAGLTKTAIEELQRENKEYREMIEQLQVSLNSAQDEVQQLCQEKSQVIIIIFSFLNDDQWIKSPTEENLRVQSSESEKDLGDSRRNVPTVSKIVVSQHYSDEDDEEDLVDENNRIEASSVHRLGEVFSPSALNVFEMLGVPGKEWSNEGGKQMERGSAIRAQMSSKATQTEESWDSIIEKLGKKKWTERDITAVSTVVPSTVNVAKAMMSHGRPNVIHQVEQDAENYLQNNLDEMVSGMNNFFENSAQMMGEQLGMMTKANHDLRANLDPREAFKLDRRLEAMMKDMFGSEAYNMEQEILQRGKRFGGFDRTKQVLDFSDIMRGKGLTPEQINQKIQEHFTRIRQMTMDMMSQTYQLMKSGLKYQQQEYEEVYRVVEATKPEVLETHHAGPVRSRQDALN
ncbi:uncharacterized protein LOC106165910, partial [Lingula anatina]|uniref:Uncharacterized protein LOC106165910 n=1 Tax=Lingula anatina TaxID=7574 RepID=A0A1S3IQB0_LINAN